MSQVAWRYNVSTNLVFTWLRNPRFAPDKAAEEAHAFLPVEIVEERRGVVPPASTIESRIEIDFVGGHRLRIIGFNDPEALARLIRGLSL